jgi:hypothetical protein
MLFAVNKLSNMAIINNLKNLKDKENAALADIILYLFELEARKLYREAGYSSLFTYCTECLGYSEGSAYRRIQAARSLKDNPEIYELVKIGKLSLCAVSEISKVKDISSSEVYKSEKLVKIKSELITASLGKSKEEVKILTAKHFAPQNSKKESIKPVRVKSFSELNLGSISNPTLFENLNPAQDEADSSKESNKEKISSEIKYQFNMEVDKEFMDLYNQSKALMGHIPAAQVLKRAMKDFVSSKNAAPKNTKSKEINNNTRYIQKKVRHEVFKRDNKQCTYIAADGKRCSEKHGLEFDHIKPFSLGGSNEPDNIRLLCKTHNQLLAEKTFGKEKIKSFINSNSTSSCKNSYI